MNSYESREGLLASNTARMPSPVIQYNADPVIGTANSFRVFSSSGSSCQSKEVFNNPTRHGVNRHTVSVHERLVQPLNFSPSSFHPRVSLRLRLIRFDSLKPRRDRDGVINPIFPDLQRRIPVRGRHISPLSSGLNFPKRKVNFESCFGSP